MMERMPVDVAERVVYQALELRQRERARSYEAFKEARDEQSAAAERLHAEAAGDEGMFYGTLDMAMRLGFCILWDDNGKVSGVEHRSRREL